MARYFLHLRDGTDALLDPDGVELDDIAALQNMLLESARGVIGGDVANGIIDLGYRIDAETESGDIACTVAFQSVVVIKRLQAV